MMDTADYWAETKADYDRDGFVGLLDEVKLGAVVIFNGYLHHRSMLNRSLAGTFQRALANYYMSANSMLPWNQDGRISATRDMHDILMVCGNELYRWKGSEDIAYAFLHAETADPGNPSLDAAKKIF